MPTLGNQQYEMPALDRTATVDACGHPGASMKTEVPAFRPIGQKARDRRQAKLAFWKAFTAKKKAEKK